MGRVSGKVAIITGAARGLGEAFTRRLVAEGAHVVLADVLDKEGEALAHELKDGAEYLHLDVTSAEGWDRAIAFTEKKFGPVSVLVNNAGVLGPVIPMHELTESEYRKVIDVNQVGVFLGMKAITDSMQRAGGGAIINVSSINGLFGVPNAIAYVASKFAVRGMTKAAALELASFGIRVNSIHPGVFQTTMAAGDSDTLKAVIAATPAARIADPDELSHMVLLLASDEMPYATGAEFVVDGGMTCR